MEKRNNNKARPPQLNKFMHPKNPYKKCVRFKELATAYPEFRAHCTYDITGKVYLDFKKKEAVKALTTSLLDRDFGLKVSIPDDRLVPTLPLRLNYLLWIGDLLLLAQPKSASKTNILGFDIGTGAACIYPLLGVKQFGWNFIGTETNDVNFESAKKNILENSHENSIIIKKSSNMFEVLKDKEILDFIQKVKSQSNSEESQSPCSSNQANGARFIIDFTMCNPPFFSSEAELDSSQHSKKPTRSQPVSVSTGSLLEKVTEGGEVAFVEKIMLMSLQYKEQIRIFSTLIGIKNNVKPIVRMIREKAGETFVKIITTEFCQGRTMRWGVAWTFHHDIPLERNQSTKQKLSDKPFVLYIPRSLMANYSVQNIWAKITSFLKEIKIKPHLFKENKYFVGATIKAYKPYWLHQRQKKRQKIREAEKKLDQHENNSDTSLQKQEPEIHKKEPLSKEPKLMSEEEYSRTMVSELGLVGNSEEPPSKRPKFSPEVEDPHPEENEVGRMEDADDSQLAGHLEELHTGEEKGVKPQCFLLCTLQLKQTEALISIEMKYKAGKGQKDAVYQLLQYLENRLKRDTGTHVE